MKGRSEKYNNSVKPHQENIKTSKTQNQTNTHPNPENANTKSQKTYGWSEKKTETLERLDISWMITFALALKKWK